MANDPAKPHLATDYVFAVRQYTSDPGATPEYQCEKLLVPLVENAKLWSTSFAPFGFTIPHYLAEIYVNRSPGFRTLPSWFIVQPGTHADAMLLPGNGIPDGKVRAEFFPNGSVPARATKVPCGWPTSYSH